MSDVNWDHAMMLELDWDVSQYLDGILEYLSTD